MKNIFTKIKNFFVRHAPTKRRLIQVYSALLPHCDKVLLTRVYASPEADAFFPDLDADPAWKIESESELLEEDGLKFQFIDYVRV